MAARRPERERKSSYRRERERLGITCRVDSNKKCNEEQERREKRGGLAGSVVRLPRAWANQGKRRGPIDGERREGPIRAQLYAHRERESCTAACFLISTLSVHQTMFVCIRSKRRRRRRGGGICNFYVFCCIKSSSLVRPPEGNNIHLYT